MDKDTNGQDDALLWVDRDDKGNITGWGLTIKEPDAVKILEKLVDDLKRAGKQITAEQYQTMLDHICKTEKTNRKKKTQKK